MSDAPPLVDQNGIVIPFGALLEARLRTTARRQEALKRASDPFKPAEPAPGVVPKNEPLAMDESPAFGEALAWASENYYASAYAEGTTFMGYPELSLLAQRAEYRVIFETIAEEITREWIEVKSTSDEKDESGKVKALVAELERLDVRGAFRKATELDGALGRGHLYVDTGQTDDRDELKISIGYGDAASEAWFKAKELKVQAIRPVEATWAYPARYESSDPLKADWYNPEHWYVMGKELHRSRFLTFIGRPVLDMLKPAYSFGGLSMTQQAKPYVDNWLTTRQAVTDLVKSFSVSGLKTNMTGVFQQGGAKLFERVDFFNLLRSNNGAMVLDKDTEEWFNVSTPVSGLEALQAQSQEHMAAVSRIPLVKLLGITPSGLNASSDGEIRTFYDGCHAYQEKFFRPNLTVVIRLVQISLWGKVDESIVFEFRPLWQQDEGENVANEKTKTDIDDANVAMGAVSAEEVRRRIATDKKSQYAGLNLDPDELPEPPAAEEPGELGEGPPPDELAEVGAEPDAEPDGEDEDETSEKPFAKAEVEFEHPARGDNHCHECQHFNRIAGVNCRIVRGLVEPEDWCNKFDAIGMRSDAVIRQLRG